MRTIPPESSVLIEGKVKERPVSSRRNVRELNYYFKHCDCDFEQISTGEIEVKVENAIVLNPVQGTLPFEPSDEQNLVRWTHYNGFKYSYKIRLMKIYV